MAVNTQSMLEMLQRSEVSNPPAFGAKIAGLILGRDDLKEMWYADMITMSNRIRSMRKALYEHLVSLGECDWPEYPDTFLYYLGAPGSWEHLIRQSGMFGFLGLSPEIVLELRGLSSIYPWELGDANTAVTEKYHVYMADNSRISIAGLNEGNVEYVARSITQSLQDTKK